MMNTITENDMYLMLRIYAECKGMALNPNEKKLSALVKVLLKNITEKDYPYCPCRKVAHEPFPEFACPCIYCVEDVRRHGKCLCGLFVEK